MILLLWGLGTVTPPPPPPPPSGTIAIGGGSPSTRTWPFTGRTSYVDGRPVLPAAATPPVEVAPPTPSPRPRPLPVEAQPFADIPVATAPEKPAPTVSASLTAAEQAAARERHIADATATAVQRRQAALAKQVAHKQADLGKGPVILVTRHWGGLGLALLMQRQGADVRVAFDYTGVKADELESTEKCGDGLVEKLPLDSAMKSMVGKHALWVFDGNDLPKEADRLRAKRELVIGTSALSQRLEDDRDFAAAAAESLGFSLPQTEKFTDYAKAIQFLSQNTDRAFVYKPDKQDPTATYVPLGDDPARSNEELREYLTSMQRASKPSFILQEVVHGIEANFDLWVRNGQPVAAFCDLESKRKLVGDLGENIGCAGDYLFTLPLDSPAITRTVARYLDWPQLNGYTGSVDVNVMIHNGEPLFLENCFRFGYNAYPTIFHALATAPMEHTLRHWVAGDGSCEPFFAPHVGGSLSLVVDHPKMGTPILTPTGLENALYLYRAYKEHAVAMVEGWPEVACVIGSGPDIPAAGRRCLDLAQQVGIPGKGYRIDLAGTDLPTLPQSRYRALQALGWFPRDPEDDDETALLAILGAL